ncbi:NAD(P)H oxidoreductase RTN4IP1, mitochondrial-like [Babylonia areolata]|uniref:NAD(P)H oxidoreductase RTN4IP1, mitochondrial-like n=1 Tax=Babylonia areolata TaxID=304850 RepID=UPI003FD4C72F
MSTTLFSRATSMCPTYCKSHLVFKLLKKNIDKASVVISVGSQRPTSSGKSRAKMQAWQIHQYGDNRELTPTDKARAATIKAPNELLIKVHAASVNPIDVRMRGGYGSKILNALRKRQGGLSGSEFPLILGRDFSGTVVETGQAVRRFKPGDEVWGALSPFRQGSHAHCVVASESEISKKPKSLSYVESASIPYVAATAWTALCTVGELKERNAAGKRVLIQGGSGGVGTFSVQLLKAWGAEVTATCSTDAVEFVQGLGADTVVDYRTCSVQKELARHPPFDFVLDVVGGSTADDSFELLKKWSNAKLVTIVTPLLKEVDNRGFVPGLAQSTFSLGTNLFRGLTGGQSYRWSFFMPNSRALERVSQMVDAGQIQAVVEKVFPFSDLPAAYQHVERGHARGKTVIQVADSS